ncbi:D-xylose ABC transporter ATP-binding protein, partial [Shewanella algae]
VMVARALVTDARLIILDEPTAALAPQEAAAILDMVRSLSAKGVSVLYVSHRFDDIEAVADSVTGVRDARVVADLAKEEISRSALVQL